MKKLFSICAIILIIISITGCSDSRTKKGTIIGECSKKELTPKDMNDLKNYIFDNEVMVKVVMENKGDTIHTAIVKKDLDKRLANNDMAVDVVVDESFYWIESF